MSELLSPATIKELHSRVLTFLRVPSLTTGERAGLELLDEFAKASTAEDSVPGEKLEELRRISTAIAVRKAKERLRAALKNSEPGEDRDDDPPPHDDTHAPDGLPVSNGRNPSGRKRETSVERVARIAEDELRRFSGMDLSTLWDAAGVERKYLVFPYLPEQGLVILGGRPKTAKTFIAADWSVRVGRDGKRTTFVEEEGDLLTLKKRFEAALGYQLPAEHRDQVRVAHRSGLVLNNEVSVRRFIDVQRRFGPQLIVLDSLYMLAHVKLKEQDEMAAVFRNLLLIVAELKCCVLIVHHARKASPGVKREQLEDIDDVLGSALIGANCDLMVLASKPKAQEKESLRIHLVCPLNGSRLAEPFERRLWTLTNHAGGVPSITDEEDPEERKPKENDVTVRVEEVAAVLHDLLASVRPGKVAVHTLFKESGLKVRKEVVSAAAAILRREGLLELIGTQYFKLDPSPPPVPGVGEEGSSGSSSEVRPEQLERASQEPHRSHRSARSGIVPGTVSVSPETTPPRRSRGTGGVGGGNGERRESESDADRSKSQSSFPNAEAPLAFSERDTW